MEINAVDEENEEDQSQIYSRAQNERDFEMNERQQIIGADE